MGSNHYIFVFLFIFCRFLTITGSDDKIKGNVENAKSSLQDQMRNARHYQDGESKSDPRFNYGDSLMREFERGGKLGDILGSYRFNEKSGLNFNERERYNENREFYGNEKERGMYENGFKFQFDAGNPDIHGEIMRPCQVYDTFCIRKFFSEHSKCKISGRSVPDPYFQNQGNYYFASANISETVTDTFYTGFSKGRVSEFYINKATDNLVIAFTFDAVTKNSRYTYFQYYLRGREPVVTRDFAQISYGTLTVTVIIPNLAKLNLARSEITTYGDNSLYSFVLGPGLGESTDPEVLAMYAQFFANVPIEYQEDIWNLGNLIAGNYIQYNICDFGLKVL